MVDYGNFYFGVFVCGYFGDEVIKIVCWWVVFFVDCKVCICLMVRFGERRVLVKYVYSVGFFFFVWVSGVVNEVDVENIFDVVVCVFVGLCYEVGIEEVLFFIGNGSED